jgi:hypothetical protein
MCEMIEGVPDLPLSKLYSILNIFRKLSNF